MPETKTMIRFFTIADYEEEEIWLHEQHKNGWKLHKMIPPCLYIFEKCTPEDVIYRLDYKNGAENANYFQLFTDYGWEYIGRCVGWLYFRKPASVQNTEQDGELFSDNESKIDLIRHILKPRMLPLLVIFICCVSPNFMRSIETGSRSSIAFTVLFTAMMLLYVSLLTYCGLKLRKLMKKYKNNCHACSINKSAASFQT